MANLQLNIIVVPTHNSFLLGVLDASVYVTTPVSPTIEINIPGFGDVLLPFVPNELNVFTSTTLGITEINCDQALPDGIYRIKYSIAPAYENYVEKSIMRIDKLQEKFDNAFLQLDLMECDRAIKKQASVDLNTINFYIQGAIASANNCSEYEAIRLYNQADSMLDRFLKSNCGCSGNNYQINFY